MFYKRIRIGFKPDFNMVYTRFQTGFKLDSNSIHSRRFKPDFRQVSYQISNWFCFYLDLKSVVVPASICPDLQQVSK